MRKETGHLLKQADRDLENAEKNITIEAYEVSAFLAQQAVEKYLKAAWININNEHPPFTYSLMELGKGIGVSKDMTKKLRYLNTDYTVARYPDAANGIPFEIYDEEIAEEKVKTAKEIVKWIKTKIKN